MPFKMSCPKCGGTDYVIQKDNLRYPGVDESFALVYSCRCGKQLFGTVVVDEYERQKKQYDAEAEARRLKQQEREEREREEREREERLKAALAFRNEYLRRKREEEEAEESSRREEANRQWRERVASQGGGGEAPPPPPSAQPPTETAGEAEPRTARPSRAVSAPLIDDDEEIVVDPNKDPLLCAWPPCQNERRPNSKYCSRACSNKNARFRYRQRRKQEDE